MSISLGIGVGITHGGMVPWSPGSLFMASEKGVWFDPSDLNAMYQDAARTTPVTAVEQPVGSIADKSGNGVYATSSGANRPTLSARVNLLTKTEALNDSAWTKDRVTATGSVADPFGGTTAFSIVEDTSTDTHRCRVAVNVSLGLASVVAKYNGRRFQIRDDQTTGAYGVFDLQAGTVLATNAATASITSLGAGWYRCTVTSTATTGAFAMYLLDGSSNNTYKGDGASGVYVCRPDNRPSNCGTNLPVYQRVDTSTSYDTAGFPYYLSFGGTNSTMQTGSIAFNADKLTVGVGERKTSDSGQRILLESSATIASNDGTFMLSSPNSAAANLNFSAKGTTQVDNTVTTYTSPVTNVIIGTADIAGATQTIDVNGTATKVDSSLGTGNFTAQVLNIGSRNQASAFFSGRLYAAVIRNAASSASQVAQLRSYLNGKVGKVF